MCWTVDSKHLWIIYIHHRITESNNLLRLCLPSSRSSGNDCPSSIVLEAWTVLRWHRSTQRSGQPSPWWCSLFGPREEWAGTHLWVRRKKHHDIAREIMASWLGNGSDMVCQLYKSRPVSWSCRRWIPIKVQKHFKHDQKKRKDPHGWKFKCQSKSKYSHKVFYLLFKDTDKNMLIILTG